MARVVKSVPDDQPIKMVFAFHEKSGVPLTKVFFGFTVMFSQKSG